MQRLACIPTGTLRTSSTAFSCCAPGSTTRWWVPPEWAQGPKWLFSHRAAHPSGLREGRQPGNTGERQRPIVAAWTQNGADSLEDLSRHLLWEEISCKDLPVVKQGFKLGPTWGARWQEGWLRERLRQHCFLQPRFWPSSPNWKRAPPTPEIKSPAYSRETWRPSEQFSALSSSLSHPCNKAGNKREMNCTG